jgi:uncharacterized protein (DUF2252 family)
MFKVEVCERAFKKFNEARRFLEQMGYRFSKMTADAYWFVNGSKHAYIWIQDGEYKIDFVRRV